MTMYFPRKFIQKLYFMLASFTKWLWILKLILQSIHSPNFFETLFDFILLGFNRSLASSYFFAKKNKSEKKNTSVLSKLSTVYGREWRRSLKHRFSFVCKKMRNARNTIIVMKLYFDRLPGFIIFQNVCFSYFIHFLISFSISPVFCCVILHNTRQVLKVDRISLLIIFRLCVCVLAFAICSGCFLSALQTISFLSRLFFLVLRSLSLFLLCVIEWVLSFTSIFCGYCTFAEIRRHRDDNVRVSLELYTCTFISVINLSYRSFRQTSRIHFAHMYMHIHIHTWCLPFFVFVLVVFFTTQNLLWCVWNQVFQHISTSTSFIAENKTKPIEMNTKAPLTWRFSLASGFSFKISFAYGFACQTFSRFYSALSSNM